MAHFSIPLTIVIFLLATVTSRIQATRPLLDNATKLINKTCTESLEPQICSQCITSEHSRQFDDIPGFIHSLLTCMWTQTKLARDKASFLASQNSTTSPRVKKTLAICSNALTDSVSQVEHALLSVDLSHYSDAWNGAMAARRKWFRCALEFHADAEFTIPSPLLNPMVNANRLFDASYGLFVLINS